MATSLTPEESADVEAEVERLFKEMEEKEAKEKEVVKPSTTTATTTTATTVAVDDEKEKKQREDDVAKVAQADAIAAEEELARAVGSLPVVTVEKEGKKEEATTVSEDTQEKEVVMS